MNLMNTIISKEEPSVTYIIDNKKFYIYPVYAERNDMTFIMLETSDINAKDTLDTEYKVLGFVFDEIENILELIRLSSKFMEEINSESENISINFLF